MTICASTFNCGWRRPLAAFLLSFATLPGLVKSETSPTAALQEPNAETSAQLDADTSQKPGAHALQESDTDKAQTPEADTPEEPDIDTSKRSGTDTSQPATDSIVRSLASFMTEFDDVRLRGTDASFTFDIPLPARWKPQELRLDLVYRNSVNLLRKYSQLRVELNGLVIAQLVLDPTRPEGRAQIRLPLDLLRSGYNQLVLAAAQHVTVGECEDPGAPEIWTQIDTEQSKLHLDYRRRPISGGLTALPTVFDRRVWRQEPLRILMPVANPSGTVLSDDQLSWGALAAEAAAIRLEYVPLDVESASLLARAASDGSQHRFAALDEAQLAKRDAVLIGTRDQLAPILGETWAKDVTDGYLGLFAQEIDPTRAILVISGHDTQDVVQAVKAFGLVRLPLPDRDQVLIKELSLSDIPPDRGPSSLPTGLDVSFADLGTPTATLISPMFPARWLSEQGLAAKGSSVERSGKGLHLDFWMTPGFYSESAKEGTLRLRFSYGAGLRRDSVLNILVNDTFVRGVLLDDPQGASIDGYDIRFPLELLRAGENRIDFMPMMVALETDQCRVRQGENLLVTIYGDSSLRLPPLAQFARLPELKLMARAGFPLVRDPRGADFAVQVSGHSPKTASAAWTLLARLAQISRVPLDHVEIGNAPEARGRDLLVVGDLDALDPALMANAPLRVDDAGSRLNYTELETISEPRTSGGWWSTAAASVTDLFSPPPDDPERFYAQITLGTPPLGRLGAFMAMESSTQPGHSVFVLSAVDPALLLTRTQQLVKPELWFNMRGDLVLWGDDKGSFHWQPATHQFTLGDGPTKTRLSYFFSHYPQALLITTVVLVALLAWLLLLGLLRFRRRHHPLIPHGD